ncbi:MAG: methyltransferase [Candidatus Gallionella acididurans]|uniref:Methyltransferase n=1 Tax=Candidatus Gallionella acididurans TaxID=1796491 RepID=A0A139BRI9_9PROT|nr:MAG: methyltransferase [Candidatus Gallionella acididurans]
MQTMTANQSEFIQLHHASDQQLRAELSAGLLSASAFASPKYFYDALGSRLFAAICELPEYYLSRTEASIIDAYLGEIAAAVGMGGTLIDLGAGNCAKAARLFPALQPAQYVPIDISVDFLRDAVGDLQQRFPHIRMTGLGLDFSSELQLPDSVQRRQRLFFYPGSSIGNFTPAEAAAFFRRLHAACGNDGGLLVGVDLVKATAILDAAYNDALGVTAAFNLNLLLHLNRLLGADFDIAEWRHVSFFNTAQSRIEMYLEARQAVTVKWQGGERRFQQGERIHTENSYKYTPEDFVQLLQQAGFKVTRTWNDADDWFMVCHARAM